MYALAEEKGMTVDQFKAALLEERNKAVDKAVADGTITTEEGVSLKETLKNNLDTCTGVPGQRLGINGAGRRNGQGTGHMSGGGMRGSVYQYPKDYADALYACGMNLVAHKNPVVGTKYKLDDTRVSIRLPQTDYLYKNMFV